MEESKTEGMVVPSVTRVYIPWFFVSSQQRFGATDIKALGASELSGLGQTVLQLLGKHSVTAPFYLEDSRRIQDSKRREWRSAWGGRKRERERESARACTQSKRKRFGSSFYMFFLPPGPALCKLGLARSAVCSA